MLGMIDSMTPNERKNPKLIDTPRRNRIARGSGVAPSMVTGLIKQFSVMGPMMQAAAGGGMKDRMAMMQQMQNAMMSDPNMSGVKTKKSTGKRLSAKEKARMKKDREKQLRKAKRKKK